MASPTTADAPSDQSARFSYGIINIHNESQQLEADVPIPFTDNVSEFAQSIIDRQNDAMISVMDLRDDIAAKLLQFVDHHNQLYYDRRDDALINDARTGSNNAAVDQLIKSLDALYKEEIQQIDDNDAEGQHQRTRQQLLGTEDSLAEQFSQSFHRLVHSAHLPDILQRECDYAHSIATTKHRLDTDLATLADHHREHMDAMVEQLDIATTAEDINRLLTEQYANMSALRAERDSELSALKGHQRAEYHQWLATLENMPAPRRAKAAAAATAHQVHKKKTTESPPVFNATSLSSSSSSMTLASPVSLEESFTIHLGSQLKHMHNIRILAGDIARLCGPLHAEAEDSRLSALSMSLGLYGHQLSGIVVLTPVGCVHINPAVHTNANMSTDFHFEQVDEQLAAIQQRLNRVKASDAGKLRPGDFFVTRHSNLAQAHIVFHLVTDEAFAAQPAEIGSRHAVILGLRNVMKMACRHDVTLLTVPALLRHEMGEDMTVPWCTRRAELVYKCAKGFMIESATWGGSQLSTLQLLLPHDISEELFGTLVGMVPHIFRVANPKFLEEASGGS